MDFEYSEKHEAIRKMVREFAEKEVRPGASERDRAGEFDEHLLKRMGELGIMGIRVPEEYGGSNSDCMSLNLATEEIGRVDSSLAWTTAGAEMPRVLLENFNQEQKDKWRGYIEGMAKGEALGAMGITEPGAGSDVPGIQNPQYLQAYMAEIGQDQPPGEDQGFGDAGGDEFGDEFGKSLKDDVVRITI